MVVPIEIGYSLAEDTAKPSLDYVPTSGRLVFPPGVTELSVKTRLIDEARFELTENFYLEV